MTVGLRLARIVVTVVAAEGSIHCRASGGETCAPDAGLAECVAPACWEEQGLEIGACQDPSGRFCSGPDAGGRSFVPLANGDPLPLLMDYRGLYGAWFAIRVADIDVGDDSAESRPQWDLVVTDHSDPSPDAWTWPRSNLGPDPDEPTAAWGAQVLIPSFQMDGSGVPRSLHGHAVSLSAVIRDRLGQERCGALDGVIDLRCTSDFQCDDLDGATVDLCVGYAAATLGRCE